MRTIPAPMQAKLDGGVTTFCYCWHIIRTDGVHMGFTEHDRNLVVAGITYLASSGFTPSGIQESLGLAVNNAEAVGALSSSSITEDDLARGLYHGASFELLYVDWSDTTSYAVMFAGDIGEVKKKSKEYTAELRGISAKLNQKMGRILSYYCDAVLGDARCGVDLTDAAFTSNVAVTAVTDEYTFSLSGLGARAAGWASGGTILFSSGQNNLVKLRVKKHALVNAVHTFTLWEPAPFAPIIGDTAVAKIGCDHTFPTCKSTFSNGVNHRGCPYMVGNDLLTRYPNSDDSSMDGGSLYGN